MIIQERDEYTFLYSLYLINEELDESLQDIRTRYYINESSEVLMEADVKETLKAFVDRIIQAVTNVWEKFKSAVEKLIGDDKEWLKKNEKIIKDNKPKETNINNYYDYNLDKLKNSTLPDINVEEMEEMTKEEIIEKYFVDFKPEKDQSFTDRIKEVLRGGTEAKTIKSTELDINKILEYVQNYDDLKNKIDTDVQKIKNSSTKAYAKIKISSAVTPKNKVKIESTYQDTLDYYFNEAIDIEKSDEEKKAEEDKENGNDASSNGNNSSENTNSDTSKKTENAIKNYYNLCSQFLGLKLTIAQEVYKTYMKILRWHVGNFSKEQPKEEEKKEETTDNSTEEKK